MSYQRIQPFPAKGAYHSPELKALADVWLERKASMEKDGAYLEFLKKLQREWAIETGIIERLYTWDRGVTEVLINQGIESAIIAHRSGVSQNEAEHIQALIDDHVDIVEGLFGYIKQQEPLNESFIRNLQAKFTAHQDTIDAITETGESIRISLIKGDYKKLPNNPKRPDGMVHVYCPPELTKEEMESLIRMYREAEGDYPSEVKSAWLHHRFTQIHPFQDGNGRVARALASLVFLQEGLFPLVIRDSDRKEYIKALETADNGDLEPLVTFFSRRQRDSILKALGLEQQAQQSQYANQIIASALEVLRDRFNQERKRISVVYIYADRLVKLATKKFRELELLLDPQLQTLTPTKKGMYQARATFSDNTSTQRHYFQKQIVDVASKFEYFANFENYRAWNRISITTDQEFQYLISFHGYGPRETGILAVSAFTYIKAPREEGGTEPVSLHPASTDLFQFNYAEDFGSIEKRFQEWLDSSMAIALAEWKRFL